MRNFGIGHIVSPSALHIAHIQANKSVYLHNQMSSLLPSDPIAYVLSVFLNLVETTTCM